MEATPSRMNLFTAHESDDGIESEELHAKKSSEHRADEGDLDVFTVIFARQELRCDSAMHPARLMAPDSMDTNDGRKESNMKRQGLKVLAINSETRLEAQCHPNEDLCTTAHTHPMSSSLDQTTFAGLASMSPECQRSTIPGFSPQHHSTPEFDAIAAEWKAENAAKLKAKKAAAEMQSREDADEYIGGDSDIVMDGESGKKMASQILR
ncbi:hypothetical protein C8J57DRAFT_1578702 [Mycena rebaudengoi]|nr:hypothetical protein C8J57DRAFT_1578702 [Mycena rebaudengoi]